MTSIISGHSFRGGTGKSNTTASLAALLAAEGKRVGVIDTDIQSPGLHVLFGLRGENIQHALNDYLWGKASIEDTALPVLTGEVSGALYLIPSSIRADEIVQVLRQGYDMRLLATAFRQLSEALDLDVLLIDTHPGLNEETLFSLAISTAVVIVMRPDQQDYEGTGVTIEVARTLEVPQMTLIVNKAPRGVDPAALAASAGETFGCPVGAVLLHSDEMLELGSSRVFALAYPEHPITRALRDVARQLVDET
jgi:MinD-like ATPase involved in chromosome partitioning or flagellar assembly